MTVPDRVAIVTGAGHGIGRATALALAEAGFHVAAVDLDASAAKLTADAVTAAGVRGLAVDTCLAMGDPATELIKVAAERSVDLIAMSTHGHRFLQDVFFGATADRVRHLVRVPVLLLRAQ